MFEEKQLSFTLETVSSIGSYLRIPGRRLPTLEALDHFQLEADYSSLPSNASQDLQYLHYLVARILHRGVGTLPSLAVERMVVSLYGKQLRIQEKASDETGSVEWQLDEKLWTQAVQFNDYLADWHEPGPLPQHGRCGQQWATPHLRP